MSDFLRNVWYMAGWSTEVGEQLLARRIAGQPAVLFRADDGTAVALEDRCPHRFAPLSLGTRDGDRVACGYHGLVFDRSGTCVRNPFGDRIPAAARVRSFAVLERDGIVWVWGGDAEANDPALVPSFGMLAESGISRTLYGYTRMRANYEYGTDNLMDLSHIEFVHKGSFAGAGVIFAGRHEVTQDGATLRSDWWMPRVRAPAHTAGIYPPDMITDHWLEMRWNAPASMYLQIGAAPADAPRETGVVLHQAHILTPETEGTTHYFWASTYAQVPGQPDMAPIVRELLAQAFDQEDKAMIEAAYANLEGADFWSQRPLSLGVDQGGLRTRRLLQEMRRAELAEAAE